MTEDFKRWWLSSKYMQVVYSGPNHRQIACDGWDARQPEIDALKAEVKHWKANHENMVNRSRVLIDRPDLPLERVQAFRQIERLQAEVAQLKAEGEPVAIVNSVRNSIGFATIAINEGCSLNPGDFLYTRSDDKLRKLAEEYIEYMCPGADVDRSSAQIFAFLYTYEKKIRAALDK
jgi:hypothetical protein